jgi:hypothetical protein
MDGRAAIHVAGWPLLPVSTDFRIWDTLVNQLRILTVKSRPEPTQSVAGRPRGWAGQPAGSCAHLTCGLAPHGLRVTNIPVVTLSLVEFQMFL